MIEARIFCERLAAEIAAELQGDPAVAADEAAERKEAVGALTDRFELEGVFVLTQQRREDRDACEKRLQVWNQGVERHG